MEPSADFMDWKGIRDCLKAQNIATIGPVPDTYKAEMAKITGELAAKMICAIVNFSVTEVRPFVERARGGRSRYRSGFISFGISFYANTFL
jgi:hypothetical protein